MANNSGNEKGNVKQAETEKEAVLPPKSNFSEWFNTIIDIGKIMDVRYPVKGLYVWYPFGFGIRKRVYSIIRDVLDNSGHEETLFPLLIPENEFMKEAEHIKGFENEVYWVTRGGMSPLDVNLALRPTSETAIYPMYKLWVRSHADLPIKLYQIVNTFRYETKHTRPLIRLREITSFKEAHTVHATWDEAKAQVDEAVMLYTEIYRKISIPVLISQRPDWDKFPGGDYTIALDAVMPDGKTLQIGTAHHLGTNFAKTYDITYENENGEQVLANQTCYGISERSIAALISLHGDDKGLVLPPVAAPIQVVVIPVLFKQGAEEVMAACNTVVDSLKKAGIRVETDASDLRPGAKYYKWELKGVCLRIEIGPKDIEKKQAVLVRRDTGQKEFVPLDNIVGEVNARLSAMGNDLYAAAEKRQNEFILPCKTLEEVKTSIQKGVATIPWCESEVCGKRMEEEIGAKILGIPTKQDGVAGTCPVCGNNTPKIVYVAKTY
ncbi:proline--tRNA ligase [Methanolapillus millepedarum]|uniref:Proline--tRNA ligase n=1 Tax=Methanolapillus millepedarum TaxID=3028296 RepID=A0AA96V2L0_9EURY|nr:Proline--tRNA ligase [Methanosarcinaceae archaeon Ac7]